MRELRVGLEPARDLETVEAGHHGVEQDHVGQRLGGARERRLAVERDQHGVAGVVERVVQRRDVVRHVVDDQHDGVVERGIQVVVVQGVSPACLSCSSAATMASKRNSRAWACRLASQGAQSGWLARSVSARLTKPR